MSDNPFVPKPIEEVKKDIHTIKQNFNTIKLDVICIKSEIQQIKELLKIKGGDFPKWYASLTKLEKAEYFQALEQFEKEYKNLS